MFGGTAPCKIQGCRSNAWQAFMPLRGGVYDIIALFLFRCHEFVIQLIRIAMMKASLVIYEDAVLSAVAGVIDLLAGANNFFRQSGREPAFQLELVGEKVENIQLS